MKKLLGLILTVVMTLAISVTASGCAINKDGEVSVLWDDCSDVYVQTLKDSMDRSMYIENIDYEHYDAKGDPSKQLQQVDEVLNKGCSGIIIKLASGNIAQDVVNKAKAKDVPVVFIESGVEKESITGYDKWTAVDTNTTTYISIYSKLIGNYVVENYDKLDRNDDGKINFGGVSSIVEKVNEILTENNKSELNITNNLDNKIELIVTATDEEAVEYLLAIREFDLNKDKLETHYVGLFTVGIDANASEVIKTPTTEQDVLDAYTVMSAIDAGLISGAILENDDGLTGASAKIMRNFIKGDDMFKDVDNKDGVVLVDVTTYPA